MEDAKNSSESMVFIMLKVLVGLSICPHRSARRFSCIPVATIICVDASICLAYSMSLRSIDVLILRIVAPNVPASIHTLCRFRCSWAVDMLHVGAVCIINLEVALMEPVDEILIGRPRECLGHDMASIGGDEGIVGVGG